jgi:hypothetical protein
MRKIYEIERIEDNWVCNNVYFPIAREGEEGFTPDAVLRIMSAFSPDPKSDKIESYYKDFFENLKARKSKRGLQRATIEQGDFWEYDGLYFPISSKKNPGGFTPDLVFEVMDDEFHEDHVSSRYLLLEARRKLGISGESTGILRVHTNSEFYVRLHGDDRIVDTPILQNGDHGITDNVRDIREIGHVYFESDGEWHSEEDVA